MNLALHFQSFACRIPVVFGASMNTMGATESIFDGAVRLVLDQDTAFAEVRVGNDFQFVLNFYSHLLTLIPELR